MNFQKEYLSSERVYVSKKTGNKYLMADDKDHVRIDIEKPVERDLSKYINIGSNNDFDIYELTIKKKWIGPK